MITKTINRASLTKEACFSKENNYFESISQAKRSIDYLFKLLFENLSNGRVIYFKNLGRLKCTIKDTGRPVRNPKTGEEFIMPDTVQISFSKSASIEKNEKFGKYLHSEIIRDLEKRFKSKDAALFIYGLLEKSLREVQKDGARIEIRGFGTFSQRLRNPRVGRNPRTGDSVDLPERKMIFFKAGKLLQKETNKNLLTNG